MDGGFGRLLTRKDQVEAKTLEKKGQEVKRWTRDSVTTRHRGHWLAKLMSRRWRRSQTKTMTRGDGPGDQRDRGGSDATEGPKEAR
ncbi:hypothetical protein EJ110_NYTH08725 [Nymphaea thermarum]|nr:hypothetical protein EJ110_NYTH08725 [Nymphaea thermarum]